MPQDKVVEARHQTQHKLELMERYWATWCRILAQAGSQRFCNRRLWLIDTMAGQGLHFSACDPDGFVPGTPLQAVLAARRTQAEFPSVTVAVRANEKRKRSATRLEQLLVSYRGSPPFGVDVRVDPVDWVEAVPAILAEIASEDHPHGGRPHPGDGHDHRSLWFIDPYGVEAIDRRIIDRLPRGCEVIVNLDVMGILRHAGKARRGIAQSAALLDALYSGPGWREAASVRPTDAARGKLARIFAESFRMFEHRNIYALRPSGSQDRYVVHLTHATRAVEAFARAHATALRADTVLANSVLSKPQRDNAAKALFELLRGQTLTVGEMYGIGTGWTLAQLRSICRAADDCGYGRWSAKDRSMDWFADREAQPGFGLL